MFFLQTSSLTLFAKMVCAHQTRRPTPTLALASVALPLAIMRSSLSRLKTALKPVIQLFRLMIKFE